MEKATSNILNRIGKLIPGYYGYSKRQKARDSDYSVRLFVKNKLEILIDDLEQEKLEMSDDLLMDIDAIQNKLRLISVKIQNQKHGYKALFDNIDNGTFNENMSEVILNDEQMIELVSNSNYLSSEINELKNLYKELNRLINERKEILN